MPQRPYRHSAVHLDGIPFDAFATDSPASMRPGRPYLTMCIDAATRTPLGHHLSCEPPSVRNALLALRQAIAQGPMPPSDPTPNPRRS